MSIDRRLHRAARELREVEIEPHPFEELSAERPRPAIRMTSAAPVLIVLIAAVGALGVLTTTGSPVDDTASGAAVTVDELSAPLAETSDTGALDGDLPSSPIDAGAAMITAREELNLIRHAATGTDMSEESMSGEWMTGNGRRVDGPS